MGYGHPIRQDMTPSRLQRALEASFDELSARVPATIGVAIASQGEVYSLGRWRLGVAWSTIKVPLGNRGIA